MKGMDRGKGGGGMGGSSRRTRDGGEQMWHHASSSDGCGSGTDAHNEEGGVKKTRVCRSLGDGDFFI